MAFVDPLDPDTPADTNLVSEGDDRIRELKRALTERLAQVIEGWPDTDPLKLKTSAFDVLTDPNVSTIKYGDIADRPNPADSDFFLAIDENLLYAAQPDLETPENPATWVAVNPEVAVPMVSFAGMKTKTLLYSNRVTVPVSVSHQQIEFQLTGDASSSDYLVLDCRARVKEDSDADFHAWWSLRGHHTEITPILAGGARSPVADTVTVAVGGIAGYDLDPNSKFLVSLAVRHETGPGDIDLEVELRLLAINDEVPVDA